MREDMIRMGSGGGYLPDCGGKYRKCGRGENNN